MKVTQEKLPASQIGLEIEIPAETSQKTYEKVVQNLARTANIPGFRKGKVPRPILLQRLGTQRVKAAALEELIQQGIEAAIKQEEIESLGNYQLRSSFDELIEQYQPGQALTFSASVDISPTVELGDYKSLNVKAEETVYDSQKVEDWLEERQIQQATLIPVEDRAAQMADIAVVDYQGCFATETGEAGEPISGIQGTDFKVEMLDGRFVEGMVEGMVGMMPEETKDILVTFPADYPREDVAGKEAIFTITLKELKAKELPDLDDDFAEEVSEFATIAELRSSLEEQFTEEAANVTKNSIHEAISSELVNICAVDLPGTMIEKEVDLMLTQTAMQVQQMGIDVKQLFNAESIPRMRENARPDAMKRIKQSLIVQEIAKVEAIVADEDAIAERMNKVQEELSDREIDLERLREVVTEEMTTEKTLSWLQEQILVELVPKGSLEPIEEDEEYEEDEDEWDEDEDEEDDDSEASSVTEEE